MERFGYELAQHIVERLPRNTNYIIIQGEELYLDCFSLGLEGAIEDLAFIQAACVMGVVKQVKFSTWRITLEWGFDDDYLEVRISRLDLEEIRVFF